MRHVIKIKTRGLNLKLGGINPLFLIAGPCVIEDAHYTFEMAKRLKKITEDLKIPFIFKASYDKANRSSRYSYRGPGLKKGLEILSTIKEKLSVPVLSDVHSVEDVAPAAEVLDVIQIPALLSRQTDLIIRAGKTGRVLNLKKGQFMAPWDMKNVIEKATSTGNKNIILTERGTTFGYNNLVSDMRSIAIMKATGYPVVFDASHSAQLPGAGGNASGGMPEMIPVLAKSAVAAGCDGLFIEVHDEPLIAKSDGQNSLNLRVLSHLLNEIKAIRNALKLY